MEQFISAISDYSTYIILGLLIFNIILFIMFLVQNNKIKHERERYQNLTKGLSGVNFEELFMHVNSDINNINSNLKRLEDNLLTVETNLTFAIQKIGFLRYNAFADMGSELSFSIALLDKYNNGFVLTSIYGREKSVSFAKPIKNGESNIPLSPEEMIVIDRAKRGEKEIGFK
ncbi:MAG: DUF4446 family protein [Tissierellales bacterium]|nr:DUF4446 family protein [Tissierellales bacterium]